MKTKLFLVFSLPILLFSSCKEDKTNGTKSSGIVGYYVDVNSIPKSADFAEINQAIRDHELIYSLAYIRGNHEYDTYATVDLFFNDGWWSSYEPHYGPYRFKPDNQQSEVWHIVNANTIEYAFVELASPRVNAEVLIKIQAPSPIGNLVMASDYATSYTYQRVDNKLYVTDGTIFTIIDKNTIQKEGSSAKLSKYDPNKSF